MGFPFDTPTWDSVLAMVPDDGFSGAIFMGQSSTGIWSVIAIVICIAALLVGNGMEASKYKNHK